MKALLNVFPTILPIFSQNVFRNVRKKRIKKNPRKLNFFFLFLFLRSGKLQRKITDFSSALCDPFLLNKHVTMSSQLFSRSVMKNEFSFAFLSAFYSQQKRCKIANLIMVLLQQLTEMKTQWKSGKSIG
jgi:hypothetical protein